MSIPLLNIDFYIHVCENSEDNVIKTKVSKHISANHKLTFIQLDS